MNTDRGGGFRLILLINKKFNHIVLLNIYPKLGKLGQENQQPSELVVQLRLYKEQVLEKGNVVSHDVSNLKEIIATAEIKR